MDSTTHDLLICTACGTQFSTSSRTELTRCRICDDPRQFVPPTGQAFTALAELRTSTSNYHNKWSRIDPAEDRFWQIYTEPSFAIGQRAILIKTPAGNILWDCIAFLDTPTKDWIDSLGGLKAIVISHPHYYTTHLLWAATFSCPVYLSTEDRSWLSRLSPTQQIFISSTSHEIEISGKKTGVRVLKPGGHFPGSLVLLAHKRLLVADTLVTTPSGKGDWSLGPGPSASREGEVRPAGMNTYAFMWSIPNMIPLSREEVEGMWRVLGIVEFEWTHGAFVGTDVRSGGGGSGTSVKERVRESMKIQARAWGGEIFLD